MITQKSGKKRNTTPSVNDTDLKTLVKVNNSLGFNLYKTARGSGTNLFFSPYSIIIGLAMAYAGARGDTEKAMAESLNLSMPQARLHPTLNYLDLHLAKRGRGSRGKGGESFALHAINAIWGQKDYKFTSQFLDILAQNYGAGLKLLDFVNEREKSRAAINQWISNQTEGKIKDLVPEGVIDQLTRLILTNAIYFKARWQYPFYVDSTADEIFHCSDAKSVYVDEFRLSAAQ